MEPADEERLKRRVVKEIMRHVMQDNDERVDETDDDSMGAMGFEAGLNDQKPGGEDT